MKTCENCRQPCEDLFKSTLNIQGLGMWTWSIGTCCAKPLSHAALQSLKERAMLNAPPDPSDLPPTGAITGSLEMSAEDDVTDSTCEVCGRLCVDDSKRCTNHPRV